MMILGVDGGATKTLCTVADENFVVLGVGVAGPCNFNVVGVREARKNVKLAIKRACSTLDLKNGVVEVGCFGISGLTTDSDYEVISDRIVPSNIAKKRIIVNDVVTAFYAVTNGKPGIAVVAGTGSIAYGMNSRGEKAVAGGWGWLMGDEGSAFDIARRGLNAAARACDGRGEETLMVNMFKEEFKVEDFKDVVSRVYQGVSSTKIASLSKIVFSAAEAGDKVAIKILEEAGEELGQLAVTIGRRLFVRDESINIGVSGGVFKASNIPWEAFKKYVANFLPKALFIPPVSYPVVGALIIGYEKLGISINEENKAFLLENLEEKIADLQNLSSEGI